MIRIKRITVTGLSTALVAVAIGSSPAMAFKDKDCSDFKSQKQAQKFFKKHDPKKDPHGLDADNDGVACEDSF